MKFGIQQLQLGSILKNESMAKKALYALKESHYCGIELNGFMLRKSPWIVKVLTGLYGMPIKNSNRFDWKRLLSECHLDVISIHEDIDTLEKRQDLIYEEAEKYQTDKIILTGMYNYDYANKDAVASLCHRLNKIGKELKTHNLKFLYHNHNVEFVRFTDKKTAYDYLIEHLDEDYVNFEFDSYWPATSGIDSAYYMRKLGKRLVLHHICDHGNLTQKKFLTPIIKNEAVELGSGNLPLKTYLEIDSLQGVETIILEQHRHYIHNNPIESFVQSADYLKNLLNQIR